MKSNLPISEAAAELLAEMEERFLEVTLVPAPVQQFSGHMIRVSINQNPHWYQELFDRQYVKRRRVERHLSRIAETGVIDQSIPYHDRLAGIIESKAKAIQS